MKKYSFLVYHREYEQFLNKLQELGVVHVIEKESGELENEELKAHYAKITDITNAVKFLEKREVEDGNTGNNRDVENVLEELQNAQHTFEYNTGQLEHLNKEHATLAPWGDFKWESIEKLNEAGLHTKLLISSAKVFEDSDWSDKYFIEEITHKDGHVYFALFYKQGETIEIDAEEAHLSSRSLSEIEKLIGETEEIIQKSEEIFDNLVPCIPQLNEYKDKLQGVLSFELVKLNTHSEAENKLMVLEGWCPEDTAVELDTYLEASGIYFESEKPDIEETPPIKLKNNKFARLYESIGELYTFPKYGELDLTPFFAPFYMLFFGFCLGDAGYGLLITLGCIYGIFKAKDNVKPLLKLGMYLGIATTFMGILGGTFFGIFLIDMDWPWIKTYQNFIMGQTSQMYLALALGYIQVVFGMFLKAANKARMYGFKHCISQLGWNIIVVITLPVWAMGNFNVIPAETANMIALVSGIVGAIPAFFYNTPGKNPLLNLGVGLWDTYQTASGLLGDILSYIRLFALGLSSAILGNVFNTLAMDLSPDVIIARQLVMILILAFGHSLNFFMAALGSFVHPLRLTFVEFYKNAGFMGGGKKYEPFSK